MYSTMRFTNHAEYKREVRRIVRSIGIHPNTNGIKGAVRLEMALEKREQDWADWYGLENVDSAFLSRIHTANAGINHAYRTGRLKIEAEQMLREISIYQRAQMVINMAFKRMTMDDVKNWLNGQVTGHELPID